MFRLLIAICPLCAVSGAAVAEEKDIFGWVERVKLLEGDVSSMAKLDSGAKTFSLDAREIET